MKDVFSAFGSEFFRPLVTLLLPGAISVSTWITAGILASTTIRNLVNANRAEAAVVAILLMLFVGLVCEDLGSHLEEFFDRKRDRRDQIHKANWKSYLRIAYRLEPIGHRYLRTVVLRLKFELGSLVACVFALLGAWFLPLPITTLLWCSLSGILLSVFFAYEAWGSHQLLGEIRAELLKGINEFP